jgi:hypothetical protein
MQKIISRISLALFTSTLLVSCVDPSGLAGLVKAAAQTKTDSNTSASSSTSTTASGSASTDLNLSVDASASASFSGLKASNCSEEGTIKSATGPATKIAFKNDTAAEISIYWLNAQGTRQLYKKLAAGQTHNQSTYVTHPWLIANAQDACIGIYTSDTAGSNTINVTSQGSSAANSGSTTGTASGNVSLGAAAATPERVQQAITCLKAKGDTSNAAALSGLLNLYTTVSKISGADIAAKAYLSGTTSVMEKTGC